MGPFSQEENLPCVDSDLLLVDPLWKGDSPFSREETLPMDPRGLLEFLELREMVLMLGGSGGNCCVEENFSTLCNVRGNLLDGGIEPRDTMELISEQSDVLYFDFGVECGSE